MSIQVIMPQLGESVNEASLTKWLKAVGDTVDENEPLVEVNTDKVDTEVPSPARGVILEILAPVGATVQAGMPLAVIGQAGEAPIPPRTPESAPASAAVSTPQLRGEPSQPVEEPTAPTAPGRGRQLGFISPVVARMANELRIDLYKVPGTGQGGRITKKDLLNYIERREGQEARSAAPAIRVPEAPAGPALPPGAPPAGAGEIVTLSPVRRLIAEHMVLSKHTSPHVTTIMEADLSRVVAHRQANKDAFGREGVNLTFTVYFAAAAVAALKAYPLVNSSWTEGGILMHRAINIGMATSLGEAGLIVPVIKVADGLSLLGLARAINDLSGRARARQLKTDEVQGGTFTITNHGVSGSLFATPIINQPQCGILGVGAIQKRVVVLSDQLRGDSLASDGTAGDVIAIRPMVYLGLTFDHRIMDGVVADTFLAKVVETLQNWS